MIPPSFKRISTTSLAVFLPLFGIGLWYFPILNDTIRFALVGVFLVIAVEVILLFWRFRGLRWVVLTTYAVGAIFLLLPGTSQYDRMALREEYVHALHSYEGAPYVWGGEGRFGIDCSGLVRRGMEDALVRRGVFTANPHLVRSGMFLWWRDNTARGLAAGDSGRTIKVTQCRTLNELDHSLLLPGDLAVTTSGVHVMAYLGDRRWIGADPDAGKTTIFTIPENRNAYFISPMNIIRWTALATPE